MWMAIILSSDHQSGWPNELGTRLRFWEIGESEDHEFEFRTGQIKAMTLKLVLGIIRTGQGLVGAVSG